MSTLDRPMVVLRLAERPPRQLGSVHGPFQSGASVPSAIAARTKPFAELYPCAMDPRPHRADRDPENRGGFLIGELSKREQQEGVAIVVGESQERRDQLRPQALCVESRDVVNR